MNWTRSGSVHACAPYVIEPATEHYGVIRYRLTGSGLDEMSRDVDALKRMAETHHQRVLAEAQEQRQRQAETRRQRASIERHRAEIAEKVESVLPPPVTVEARLDWSALDHAEHLDRTRREAAELFEQRQAEAKREHDEAEQHRLAILRGRRAEGYPEVKCPGCKADLNADARSFVEDTDLVRYRCVHCDTRSAWDFDTPVPVLVMA